MYILNSTEAAVQNIRALEEVDFKDIVVSVKSSDIRLNTAVYRRLYKMTNHPLHIGLTEAGTLEGGIIKANRRNFGNRRPGTARCSGPAPRAPLVPHAEKTGGG